MKSQPGHAYLETLKTLKDTLNDSESKAQTSLNALNDLTKVEKALQEKKVTHILGLKTVGSFLIPLISYFEIFFQLFKKILVIFSQIFKSSL